MKQTNTMHCSVMLRGPGDPVCDCPSVARLTTLAAALAPLLWTPGCGDSKMIKAKLTLPHWPRPLRAGMSRRFPPYQSLWSALHHVRGFYPRGPVLLLVTLVVALECRWKRWCLGVVGPRFGHLFFFKGGWWYWWAVWFIGFHMNLVLIVVST